jgi:hypothetical protein
VVFSFPWRDVFCYHILFWTASSNIFRSSGEGYQPQCNMTITFGQAKFKIQQASEIYWKCETVRFTGSQSNLATWRLREIQDGDGWYLTVLVGWLVCGPVGSYSGSQGVCNYKPDFIYNILNERHYLSINNLCWAIYCDILVLYAQEPSVSLKGASKSLTLAPHWSMAYFP